MDIFQGNFKTTPYDCRYFAAVYLLLRALNLVSQETLQDTLYYPLIGFVFFITSLMVCFMKPRRYFRHNVIESLLLAVATVSILAVFTINAASPYIDPILSPHGNDAVIVACLILILPAVYWIILLVYFVTPKSVFTYFCKRCCSVRCWKCCRDKGMLFEEESEETPLLSNI
jgi:membrane-associated HD superfamily phosphohydrolase